MAWTLTTSQAILFKAGANFNSTAGTSGALLALISDLAEGSFCVDTKYDWVGNIGSVGTRAKNGVSDAVSDIGAKFLIEHDMSGFTGLGEATTMINVLIDNYGKKVVLLRDADIQAWARGE